MITIEETTDTVEQTGFHITDESSANWYLCQLGNIEAEKSRITAQCQKRLAELDTDANGLKFLYDHELQAFVKAELVRMGNRRKSLTLLQGTASFRHVAASVKVSDPNAALIYAKANELPVIVTQERLDAEAYKKIANGTMLPGMDSTEARESFRVDFGTK